MKEFMSHMRDYHDLKKAVHLAYLYVQSHQPQPLQLRKNMPDPIGEIQAIQSAYQILLSNYNQLVTLYQGVSAATDTASPDLQAAIDAADAFIVANPPPSLPSAPGAGTTAPVPSVSAPAVSMPPSPSGGA